MALKTISNKKKVPKVPFSKQIHSDQQKYSRYVCDSRAIPHEIDGLKPVQRRILWAMWNSKGRTNFTKTVKIAGLTMAYHPHGDKSIQDAISAMVQNFPFANNYPLIAGEGTFGDVLDPGAIASPRYTEVRLSKFLIDAGLMESLPDIDYVPNYDESEREPVFYCGKIPIVLLNNIMGIATGFRTNMSGHNLGHVIDSMIQYLKKGSAKKLIPWLKDYYGELIFSKNDKGESTLESGFGFSIDDNRLFLSHAPQNWNRTRVIDYLDLLISDKDGLIRDYEDYSTNHYKIELIVKRGIAPTIANVKQVFKKLNKEVLAYNVITHQGFLKNIKPREIIKRFCDYRKKHLTKRFKRLAGLEKEKIDKNSELIRFIKEKWNLKVTNLKSKADFESKLKKANYKYFDWLASIPVYRLTLEEVEKCKDAIVSAKKEYSAFIKLSKDESHLINFIVAELRELKAKWN